MDEIIRGTTPSFTFSDFGFDATEISSAYFEAIQSKKQIIEKPLADAIVSTDGIRWTLTQAESLKLEASKPATFFCIWKKGTQRGESERLTLEVRDTPKNEEI